GTELMFLGLESDSKPALVSKIAGSYALSADGKKLLLRRGSEFAIVDAKPDQKFDDAKLSLAAMELRIEPRREWQQMYVDAWRIVRDWFYDPGMHGEDWDAIRERHQALLPHASTRDDLNYVLPEIAGELNAR